ncbi:hypothetical protein PUMCH_001450 [Australozyma saopauloensis]|uniref:Adenylate cyclase n=1 Tax=Australozyma saopauloensis TaxID=291208 RepID=A0AAX4H7G9_9ASCO|nr:hypothetical protein PUMCH_001450 [[Candida] saopauloensis]
MSFLRRDRSRSQLFGSDAAAAGSAGQGSEPKASADAGLRRTPISPLTNHHPQTNPSAQSHLGGNKPRSGLSAVTSAPSSSSTSTSGPLNQQEDLLYVSLNRQPIFRRNTGTQAGAGLETIPDAAVLPHTREFPPSSTLENPEYQSAGAPAPAGPGRLVHRASESYSPRLSYSNLQEAAKVGRGDSRETILKDDYQGFHRNPAHAGTGNVPPLAHPIKPRFRKKGSLLGKLIHSNRKDLEGLIDASDASDYASGSTSGGGMSHGGHGLSSISRKLHAGLSNSSHSLAAAVAPAPLSATKHKFRIPLISLHHHAALTDASRAASLSEDLSDKYSEKLSGPPSKNSSVSGPAGSPSKLFDLNLSIEELLTILKQPEATIVARMGSTSEQNAHLHTPVEEVLLNPMQPSHSVGSELIGDGTHTHTSPQHQDGSDVASTGGTASRPTYLTRLSLEHVAPDHTDDAPRHSAWKAPDSWDVTEAGLQETWDSESSDLSPSDEDILQGDPINLLYDLRNSASAAGSKPALTVSLNRLLSGSSLAGPEKSQRRAKRIDANPQVPEKKIATVFGIEKNPAQNMPITRGPNHIIRIFKEDNTFTTILCPVETTTSELLIIIQKKLFLESINNFQLTLYYGLHTKVLDLQEKPLKIQLGLLTLQGYGNKDNLPALGRGDMLSIYRFVIENISLRSLGHEEQTTNAKNYVDVHISGLGLKTIPIVFHQHTFEIEKLDVSHNPAIYIPLDFIQSCSNLSSINFLYNGCLRFPHNLLEASASLLNLEMSNNFLADIPARFAHLRNLRTLKLNSNQLHSLHSNFGKLENLTTLNLSLNYFEHYPECINDITALQDLDLSYNDLVSIPSSIGKLTRLTKLNLCSNKLRGALPLSVRRLAALKRLDIRYNLITNIDVLGLLPNLEVLYASKNDISQFSDKMESLRLLKFDRNPVTTLEFEILLPMLTVLDLSKAKIAAIPAEFVLKIPNIENLVLDKNHIVTLPDEIGKLKKLSHLSVYNNNIQNLPALIGQLSALQYLDLHLNNIEKLPAEVWNLGRLAFLNVSSNILEEFPLATKTHKLSGAGLNLVSQESERGLAEALTTLYVADNRLKEEAFEAISRLTNLKYLNVSYNDFLELPEGALLPLVNLTDLHLLGNNLTKLPADDFEHLTELRCLFVNNNKLLTIPPEISNCKQLTHFDAGLNQLRYNISNWPYDWNWCHNKNLKYLNFSGNKRFEIKQSFTLNSEKPANDGYDSLLVLKHLRVLGLMDVTLTTPNVPDQSVNVRVRTTSSELKNVGYGVSDCMGAAEVVLFRDSFLQKFRGNEDEVLICSFNGYDTSLATKRSNSGHIILFICKQLFPGLFKIELERDEKDVPDALRRAFLALNREVNLVFAAKRAGTYALNGQKEGDLPELLQIDLATDLYKGCCMAVVYIRKLVVYTANLGDIEIILLRSNSDYTVLSTKHDPTLRAEFERIRLCGGYVTGNGALDLTLPILRGIGFFGYVPHTNGCPSTAEYDLASTEGVIIVALPKLWDYVLHDLAVDIVRQEKDDPIIAAEKLRDHALCYGANDRISVTVVSLGMSGANAPAKKIRRDRPLPSGDTALRRLNDEIEPPVGNIALVFTDIKNSTLLWDTYPVAMRSAIKLHNTIMRRQLRIVGGYEVKTEGDSFMVSFPSAALALLWCFNIQSQLLTEDWPTEILTTNEGCEVTDNSGNIIFRGLSVRMGIHWGSPVCELDMVTRRMDYFGPMVNRASRIESSADGGQIAVSSDFLREMERLESVHAQIRAEELQPEAAYESKEVYNIAENELTALNAVPYLYVVLGERKLKGLEAPETITLVFPDSLKIRYDIFKKRALEPEAVNPIYGALPVECVYTLRSLLLRLENVCLVLNTGYNGDDLFLRLAGDIFVKSLLNNFREKDIVGLFNHLVTRLENSIANLELRMTHNKMMGGDGRIDFTGALPIWDLLKELKMSFTDQLALELKIEPEA